MAVAILSVRVDNVLAAGPIRLTFDGRFSEFTSYYYYRCIPYYALLRQTARRQVTDTTTHDLVYGPARARPSGHHGLVW